MKKVGDFMKELGFNPKASDSVKEAFIKHLIKTAAGVDVKTPTEKRSIAAHRPMERTMASKMDDRPQAAQPAEVQLSFKFDEVS